MGLLKEGGESVVYTAQCHSPLGEILLAAKDDALIGLWFSGQKYFLGSLKEPMTGNHNRNGIVPDGPADSLS